MTNITRKTFNISGNDNANTENKDVNYLNKDFSSLKSQLIDFTKQYYPQTYKDFSDSSPGQIFIEQAAYVGDILSYYIDQQFQESFIQFASERKNIINLARSLGYKPKTSSASSTTVELFQIVPAKKEVYIDEITGESNIQIVPHSQYFLTLKPYTSLSSRGGINFLIEESVDFNQDTIYSPREITVYNKDENTNEPLNYVVKKTAQAYSGEIKTLSLSVGELSSFLTVKLPSYNVIKIISITDSNNNEYYEVDYMAQETIPIEIDNTSLNNQFLHQYNQETPKLLKYLKTARRFITYIDDNNNTYIQFGGNFDNFDNDIIIPNPTNVGVGLKNLKNINISLDNTNVLKNNSYGISPSNTTLTIKYVVGGGLNSNINSGELTSINLIDYTNDLSLLNVDQDLFNNILNNVQVNNINAATGGAGPESNEVIRQNAILNFSTQNRMVTSSDVLLRIYSMSSKFGSIAKAYVEQNSIKNISYNNLVPGLVDEDDRDILNISALNPLDRRKFLSSTNPFTNNVYLLGYNSSKHLTRCNEATIYNLKNYLNQYKILTDKFNFIDGYIINIGVKFKISVYNGFNKRSVLNECINAVNRFFNIDNMGFCQPINISQLQFNIMNIEGVQSVANIDIYNLTVDDNNEDNNQIYSKIAYNISIATKNNIIYPSKNPAIFELKYPLYDIKGIVI